MLGRFDHGTAYGHVLGKAYSGARLCFCPNRLHCHAVPENGVVPGLVEAPRRKAQSRRVYADSVSEFDECSELIDREEMPDSIGEALGHIPRIGGKRSRCVARLPPPNLALKRLRQVPVIQSGERLDAARDQFVDEAVVKVQPLWIGGSGSIGKDARPGYRESIALNP